MEITKESSIIVKPSLNLDACVHNGSTVTYAATCKDCVTVNKANIYNCRIGMECLKVLHPSPIKCVKVNLFMNSVNGVIKYNKDKRLYLKQLKKLLSSYGIIEKSTVQFMSNRLAKKLDIQKIYIKDIDFCCFKKTRKFAHDCLIGLGFSCVKNHGGITSDIYKQKAKMASEFSARDDYTELALNDVIKNIPEYTEMNNARQHPFFSDGSIEVHQVVSLENVSQTVDNCGGVGGMDQAIQHMVEFTDRFTERLYYSRKSKGIECAVKACKIG